MVQLDDLRARHDRAACAAKRIISTAPMAKFGARKHGDSALASGRVDPLQLVGLQAGRPDHGRHALPERGEHVAAPPRRAA